MGETYEVVVGPVAHGGHCVARVPTGGTWTDGSPEMRVVFVRHALPGERVTLRITEGTDGDKFWRADAVEVHEAAPERVDPPCVFSGPDRCGGCDFQHVSIGGQRELKASVVREQLVRLARLDAADPLVAGLVVEAVPGDLPESDRGLRWRTRQSYVPLPGAGRDSDAGVKGMRKHRSHDVIAIDDCLIAHPDARTPRAGTVVQTVGVAGRTHRFEVAADGFWQVHPGAPETLVAAVLDALEPEPGESVLDLYAGVGLFSAFLADRVGLAEGRGSVLAVEGDRTASQLSERNVPGLRASAGDVGAVLAAEQAQSVDLVVLDPPREGARRPVVEQVVARRPRAVAYVACDPAALGRDVAIFAEHGYRLTALRAFDLFPMTHHVECVALLEMSGS